MVNMAAVRQAAEETKELVSDIKPEQFSEERQEEITDLLHSIDYKLTAILMALW